MHSRIWHSRDCARRPVRAVPLWIFFGLVSLVPAQGTPPAPAADSPPAARQAPPPAADAGPDTKGPDTRVPDTKAADPKGEADAAKAGRMALGTLLADGSKVRCWPTDHSPTYEDAF